MRRREKLVSLSICEELLGNWANGDCVDVLVTSVVSLCMVSMVLVLSEVDLILGNGYGI